ncbi:MAG TPA: CBS domain-containing protein [Actinomycetes bacterium]|nr:CBS domain-containing protein [Actinomycetes bacterium]
MVSSNEQLFVSRLARLPVRAPSGEMIGRIADVVIARAAPGSPPVVLGLTVWVQRRPIFIGMGRVRELDAGGATLSTGTVNLRPFELRAGETLVLGELVDSRVRHRETGREYRINDVAIGKIREGWVVSALDVVEPGSGLRPWRRARHLRLTWDMVAGLEAGESAESRLAALADLRPADVAAALLALPPRAREEMASELDDDRLAATLEQLPEEVQAGLLAHLDDERAADVLEAMDPDDAADVLGEMSEAERARLLALMVPEEAEPVRRLLVYDEETAGGLMTTEPVIMRTGDTVAEALARVRDPDLPPALAGQVFVVRPPTQTPTGRYLGVAHFQRLLRELPGSPLGSCVDTDLDVLPPSLPTRRVAEYLATYDLLAAPVCDEQLRLLGAVSIDDVLDHLLPPAWRRGPIRTRGNGNGGNGHGASGRGGNGGGGGGNGEGEPMEHAG